MGNGPAYSAHFPLIFYTPHIRGKECKWQRRMLQPLRISFCFILQFLIFSTFCLFPFAGWSVVCGYIFCIQLISLNLWLLFLLQIYICGISHKSLFDFKVQKKLKRTCKHNRREGCIRRQDIMFAPCCNSCFCFHSANAEPNM